MAAISTVKSAKRHSGQERFTGEELYRINKSLEAKMYSILGFVEDHGYYRNPRKKKKMRKTA
ncbi:MAG: hypothetical protein JXN64_06390 [Spirochaetes bacterium]|nr:hypothetical protein [Spirochaetota bacterium]